MVTLLSRLRAVVESGEPVSNELALDALAALDGRAPLEDALRDVATWLRDDVETMRWVGDIPRRKQESELLAKVEAALCK